ncbi:MAG: hypothetical protein CSB44_08845 [Gammaproteobacteria bacterium]|nr:MAG: hypothetical protein CSB44_08845 [Gammaproteobacteria bacterium]
MTSRNRHAVRNTSRHPLILATISALALNGLVMTSQAASEVPGYDTLRRHVYVGVGVGASDLEPDTGNVPGTEVTESGDTGMQLTIGMDINRLFSVEGHVSDLGAATVGSSSDINNGSISYSVLGASALMHAGGARDRFKRRGVSPYLRAGLGVLQNDADESVRYRQKNGTHLMLGLGLQAAHRSGFAARGEVISFEGDATYMQLGLVYRFGATDKRHHQPIAATEHDDSNSTATTTTAAGTVQAPRTLATVAPVAAVVIADSDHDGVVDAEDQCPGTDTMLMVDEAGCALYVGTIEVVNFHSNSDTLTIEATSILDEVVTVLNRYPNASIEIAAHTDSIGEASYNQQLSERRSAAVREYLVKNGIRPEALTTVAWGEKRPIANNMYAPGRAKNRRVELTQRRGE